MTRTTLKVKLHPGEAKRFSAFLEGQEVSEILDVCRTGIVLGAIGYLS